MTFRLLWTLSIILFWPASLSAQTDKAQNITMYLQIGTLSELVLPEPYSTVQIPVQILEMRDVPGRNNQVITVHPIIPEKTQTNIRIYTRRYDFNIKVIINQGHKPTESLELSKYIKIEEPKKSDKKLAANGHVPDPDINKYNLVDPEIDFFRQLVKERPGLLKPNKQAHSMIKNRVVFGMDYVFHFNDKLVFKATLWNKSKVPFNILHLTLTYKEQTGIPLVNQHQSKAITLSPIFVRYSKKIVPPGEKSHIIYVTNKMSPQDDGYFNCVLVEKNGVRNFDFNISSFIKD